MQTLVEKAEVLEAFLAYLEKELNVAVAASRDAAAYATDAESRAESKWDTQGLEASYLAAGQAGQAHEWARAIQSLRRGWNEWLVAVEKVGVGALIQCELGGQADWYFLSSSAGGLELNVGGIQVTTITILSPIAKSMSGRKAGETFMLANGLAGKVLVVR